MEEQLLQILESSLTNKPIWAIAIAFAGGVISSVSPCVLSVLPIIIGYIGGYTEGKTSSAFKQSLLFVAGLTITLTIVGLIAALAGKVIGSFIGPVWYIVLAVISIAMGLSLLEVFYIQFPTIIKDMPKNKYGKILSPIILGMAFGLIATPCSTPILIALVSYVAYEGSLLFGTLMLIAYALGHSIIVLVCGTFTGVLKEIGPIRKWTSYITKASGILLILIGLYLIYYGISPMFLR
ncbi:MAG: cytochrome c biogenesis CcdA family protein [Vampirovibrionia bacterium]